jgi:type II restriction enzyme
MELDLGFLQEYMPGKGIPRPASGTLSGHAAGEPFDKFVEVRIAEEFPERTYRHAELLNAVYAANPHDLSYARRLALLGPQALRTLLARGKDATQGWSPEQPFVEKQNDTADVVVLDNTDLNLDDGPVHLIDVKTRNLAISGQPPNIISALKLAHMARSMLDDENYDSHDITYVGVEWRPRGDRLECEDCSIRALFKAPPENLYINWAAGLQIQFHVPQLPQDFDGTTEEWLRGYLRHFVEKAERRAAFMLREWADPFRNYY